MIDDAVRQRASTSGASAAVNGPSSFNWNIPEKS